MRTTIRINDDLLIRANKHAAAKGRTLTSLVEDGLTLILSKPKTTNRRKRVELPVSKASGGVFPGVDLNRSSDLDEVLQFCDILLDQPHCVIIQPAGLNRDTPIFSHKI